MQGDSVQPLAQGEASEDKVRAWRLPRPRLREEAQKE